MYTREQLSQKVVPICRCSFCNKGRDEAEVLIEAERPGVYICDGCLALAAKAAAKHSRRVANKVMRAMGRKS